MFSPRHAPIFGCVNTQKPRDNLDLDLRASLILKLVVERYLVDGDAVGSKTLAQMPGMRMSPATIRSVLADLEGMGLLHAAHTSAGRAPTADGMRLFLERIFVPTPLSAQAEMQLRRQLQEQLRRGREPGKVAAETLAELSQVAAIVSLPQRRQRVLRQVEFIRLQPRRVLAILVFEPGEVENRIFELAEEISVERLSRIARQLSERFAGLRLESIHQRLRQDLRHTRQAIHQALGEVVAVLDDLARPEPRLRIAGDRRLAQHQDLADPERLRHLFDALDEKQQWMELFSHCLQAGDMRIFLGAESGLELLAGCGVIAVPYAVDDQHLGVVGVVGPMRMNYASAIPLVQATAKALGEHLNPQELNPI